VDGIVPRVLSPLQLKNFNTIASTFITTPNGEIVISDVIWVFAKAYPAQAALIYSAKSHLSALIKAHARFPFSKPVPLTRDTLLRVATLLTNEGNEFFGRDLILRSRWREGELIREVMFRPRSSKERLAVIYRALTAHDAGVGITNYDDILEVLTRMPYPLPAMATRRPTRLRASFQDMAERLEPRSGADGSQSIVLTRETLRPFSELVDHFTNRGHVGEDALQFRELDMMCEEEFVEWGEAVSVLDVMNELFGVLFKPYREIAGGVEGLSEKELAGMLR
jgi:hypothetical protein